MPAAFDLHAGYALMVLLGLLLTLASPLTRHFPSAADRRRYWQLQIVTVVGALVGAKVAVLLGDALWPLRPFDDWGALLGSGRSIVGALLFGFLAAELAKPILRYDLPPNDRFATILPFSIGIGRIGCLLAGCCRGLPHDGPLALTASDGVARHPAPVYEMLFHFAMGFVLLALWRRGRLFGRLFALYLASYGLFRFFSEFLRETAKPYAGLSAYQLLCVAMIVGGGIALAARRGAGQRPAWAPYRPAAGEQA